MKPPEIESLQARVAEGERLRDAGQLEEALQIFADIVGEQTGLALAHYKLATVLARMERSEEAEREYRRALELQPDYPEAANNLAVLLKDSGYWAEAESLLNTALSVTTEYFQAHLNQADLLQRRGRHIEALYHSRRAMAIEPESLLAIERHASVLNSLGRTHDAVDFIAAHMTAETDFSPLWSTLGVALQNLGRHAEAEKAHAAAANFAGPNAWPRMNRLYFSNFIGLGVEELWQRHREFGAWAREKLGAPLAEFPEIIPDPDRRLRVGIVSGDLRKHSVAYFLPGVLTALDKGAYQLFAYSVSYYSDDVTNQLKPLFNVWRDAAGLNHDQLFAQIRRDRIDILIDASGHTNDNRLMVFARRPAPVQVTYLGYPNTTGLDTMDYRITDAIVDPSGDADAYHTEKLVRLNRCFLCYTPSQLAPPVVERQAQIGAVVFGSFNVRAKYSEKCLATWAELLQRVPGSRLVLKSLHGNRDTGSRNELVESFTALGIAAERIQVMTGKGTTQEHLASYGEVDIALDTFPYNGTTTTCEALWMGVPVVSLRGDRHASRVGASILASVGLGELVGESRDAYIEIAVALAHDGDKLSRLRSTMRERLRTSPLCDPRDMAAHMNQALRQMWQRYCASQPAGLASPQLVKNEEAGDKMRLHIGGEIVKEGWKILNIDPGEGIDFVADIRDLSAFHDECCSEIYASHVLEHIKQAEVLPVLNEWHRMLAPGGRLYISVPDLDVLTWLFMNPALDTASKFHVMRMIYGGQTTPYDAHGIGFTFDFLVDFLRDVGFESVEHVESLGLFQDDSEIQYAGHRISLNLIVTK